MNKESLAREFGVMMFHATGNPQSSYVEGGYDLSGNFDALVVAMEGTLSVSDLKDGYIAEAENFGVSKEQASEWFEQAAAEYEEETAT